VAEKCGNDINLRTIMHKNSSYSCVNTSLVQKNSKAVHQFAASSIGEMYEMLSGE